MIQTSSEHQPSESLSQLRVKICSVRLPSSTKLVDICVIMEIDNKYVYRTEVIRKPRKSNSTTSSVISVNETLDTLVTLDSKIDLKVHAPTRLFGSNDVGHTEFNLKSIIDDYTLKQTNNNDQSPSHRIQLPFHNSQRSSNPLQLNDTNNPATGMIEVIFSGSILKQQQQQSETTQRTSDSVENPQSTSPTNQTNGTATASEPHSPIDETRLAQLRQQVSVPNKWNLLFPFILVTIRL